MDEALTEAAHRRAPAHRGMTGSMVVYLLLTAVLVLLAWQGVTILLRQQQPLMAGCVAAAVACMVAAFWGNGLSGGRQPWWPIYLAVQLLLVLALFVATRLVVPVDISLAESALLCLAGEALGSWGNTRRGFTLAACFLATAFASFVVMTPPSELAAPLNQFGLIAGTVIVLVVASNRAEAERRRSAELADELRLTNEAVADLTLRAERQRMARELHDTLAQGLTGITLQLEAVKEHLERGNHARARDIVGQAITAARTTLASSREAIDDLRRNPDALATEIGRRAARFTRATGVRTRVETTGEGRLDPEACEQLLRILDESLANVARHAGARQVTVSFHDDNGTISLEVTDDGTGFEPDHVGDTRYGLTGMRERAALLGGNLTIDSGPGCTCVRVEARR